MCTKFSLFYQESYPMVVYWGAWQKMRLFTTILQLMFKMNQRQQAEAERKYKLFEEITEELSRIKQARCAMIGWPVHLDSNQCTNYSFLTLS